MVRVRREGDSPLSVSKGKGLKDPREPSVLRSLEALSSEVRLRIFRLLVSYEPEGLVAGKISSILDVSPTNLSFHLKAMAHAGLVEGTSMGRFVRYRARIRTMEEVIDYLTENCCQAQGGKGCPPPSSCE
ncbi:MAG: ArsR/SmtB family transcription factor [Leptospirillia bacterium]